ncbi:MAG: hypothetical protein HXY24_16530 [Rubrivivax sp.]|nr:hypothetical protein [Rubrivivax sp.]
MIELEKRILDWQRRQSWMGEWSFSSVMFSEEAFEKVFQNQTMPMMRFGSAWYPVENLSSGIYLGALLERGHEIGTLSGKTSAEITELYVFPVQWNLRYRFQFLEDQLIVPSLQIGLDWWWFHEWNSYSDDVDGDKAGWHWIADVGFLLDPLDPFAANQMKKFWNVDDTYLVLGYEDLRVGEGEDGLRFSGQAWTIALRFETRGQK